MYSRKVEPVNLLMTNGTTAVNHLQKLHMKVILHSIDVEEKELNTGP